MTALVDLVATPTAQPRALADAAFILKRLTATDRRGRVTFMAAGGPHKLQRLLEAQHQHEIPSQPLEAAGKQAGQMIEVIAGAAPLNGSFYGRPPRSPPPGAVVPPRSSPSSAAAPPQSPAWSFLDGQSTPIKRSPSQGSSSRNPLNSPCSVLSTTDAAAPTGTKSQNALGLGPTTAAAGMCASGQPGWSPDRHGGGLMDLAECKRQTLYSAARILRHLALDGDVRHKAAVQACLPALVRALQVFAHTIHVE